MAQSTATLDVAHALFARYKTESFAALRDSLPSRPAEYVAVVCELAALDGSLGWLAAMFGSTAGAADGLIAPSARGTGVVRDGRLTGRWDCVVGARYADLLLLSVDDGSGVLVPAVPGPALHIEPAPGSVGLDEAGICAVTVTELAVAAGDLRPPDPRLAAGAAAAVIGCADGVWRSHVERVRARLTVFHGGDEVTDDAAAQVARAASDIDASALQIIAALDGAAELSGWAYRQAVARAHGAADRLLANSRHALDAADPVSLRWRDVQAGRRLADAVITRG